MNTKITDPNSNLTDLEWNAFRYVSDEMTVAEASAFERQLEHSIETASALSRVLLLDELVEGELNRHDRSQASGVGRASQRGLAERNRSERLLRPLTLLASIAACVSAAWLLGSGSDPPHTRSPVAVSYADPEEVTQLEATQLIDGWLQAAVYTPSEPSAFESSAEPIEIAMVDPTAVVGAEEVLAGEDIVPDWMYAAFQSDTADDGDDE